MSEAATAEDIFFPKAEEPIEESEPEQLEADETEPEAAETDETEADEAEDEDEADAEGEEESEPADDDTGEIFKVKVGGEELEVGLDELLSGYQRNKDYTQKTQAIAAQERERTAAFEAQIGQLKQALEIYAVPENNEPNPADYVGNGDQFVQDLTQWKQQEQHKAQAVQVLEQLTAQENERIVAQEHELLMKAIPEWADPEVLKSEFSEMSDLAVNHWGFTEAELNETKDHRMIMLLRDAVRGRKIAQKPVVLSRSKATQPKLGAGSKVKTDAATAKRKAAVSQLKKTGETDNPEAIFFGHS